MHCPNCGTQNASPGKFCVTCGQPLPTPAQSSPQPPAEPTPAYFQPAAPPSPLAQAATTGGLTGMAGGALTVLGWLLGGGLPIMGAIFAGGGFLGTLTGDEAGGIIVLLALALAAVVAIVPITGLLCAGTSVRLFELRAYQDKIRINQAKSHLQLLRKRARTVLVMVVLMAVFASFIPFVGAGILGTGFYLMAGGAIVTFLGALFAQSQIVSVPPPKPIPDYYVRPPDTPPIKSLETPLVLTPQEKQLLALLEQETSHQEIANRLGLKPMEVSVIITDLLNRFNVQSKANMVDLARAKGLLPTNDTN